MKRSPNWALPPLLNFLAALLAAGVAGQIAHAQPTASPVYTATFEDAVTGKNVFKAKDGKRYWTVDKGADVYQHDTYERPTVAGYKLVDGKYATAEYFAYLDIVNARVGSDSRFVYVALKMFGLDDMKDNDKGEAADVRKGLIARYGFRFSRDADGRNGMLVLADKPQREGVADLGAWRVTGTSAFRDTDGDVGGRGIINNKTPSGRSVTRTDNAAEGEGLNGYDEQVITEGKNKADENVLWVRISPQDPTVVEFALDYRAMGIDQDRMKTMVFWDFESVQGGPQDPKDYRWNDRWLATEAGSPNPGQGDKSEFGTEGCVKIWELDTVPGVLINPNYCVTFTDSITGLREFKGSDGKRHWDVEPGADRYQNDVYERPTISPYKMIDGKFATDEYFAYIDLVDARLGYDAKYLYVALRVHGLEDRKSDGTDTRVGLTARYGFRFSRDRDGRNGLLVVVDKPERAGMPNTTFHQWGVSAFRDGDGDVGGRGIKNGTPSGRDVTKTDNAAEADGLNGYEIGLVTDGRTTSGTDAIWARVSPTDATVVEFALDYNALGYSRPDWLGRLYWDFEAVQGGPKSPNDYRWNDRYTGPEAGSPNPGAGRGAGFCGPEADFVNAVDDGLSEFGTPGLVKIYELDTLTATTECLCSECVAVNEVGFAFSPSLGAGGVASAGGGGFPALGGGTGGGLGGGTGGGGGSSGGGGGQSPGATTSTPPQGGGQNPSVVTNPPPTTPPPPFTPPPPPPPCPECPPPPPPNIVPAPPSVYLAAIALAGLVAVLCYRRFRRTPAAS